MPIPRCCISSFRWPPVLLLLLGGAAAVLLAGAAAESSSSSDGGGGFVSTRFLDDGERERVARLGRVTARETTALIGNTKKQAAANARLPERGIRFVQITDGRRHLVQAIYDAAFVLKDCEYVRDAGAVADFMRELRPAFERATAAGVWVNGSAPVTTTTPLRRGQELPADVGRLLDYERVRSECKTLHGKMKDLAKRAKKAGGELGSRMKRELFIYPGTNWCGMGSNSEGFNDLGLNAAADRCCRQHDHCPYVIDGFTTKYNLFNYRFHTLSHCECDERFRTCLKMVDNGPSNLVGKLFFNVVQMKCFQLKSEKTCTKRSWWGRCLKHDKQLTAHIKDVLAY